MQAFYQLTVQEVFDQLKSSASGLKSEAVPALQKKYGANIFLCQRVLPKTVSS